MIKKLKKIIFFKINNFEIKLKVFGKLILENEKKRKKKEKRGIIFVRLL